MDLYAELVCIFAQRNRGMDWNNLRYFLELSRAGRLTTAARRLGVDHTTVSRRIQTLEKNLGVQLFSGKPPATASPRRGGTFCPRWN